jgi:Bacterial Death-like domain 3/TIR domain
MSPQTRCRERASVTTPTVFISYSHRDEAWKDRLLTQLGVLQQQSILELWHDGRIGAGADWYQGISQAMAAAHVAVLLISAHFLTSSFILREEVPHLLTRRQQEGLPVVPILVTPCAWEEVPWLARMQLRPREARPLSAGNEHQIETELTAIAKEIAALIRRATPETTPPNVQRPGATPDPVAIGARPVGTVQWPTDQPARYSGQSKIAVCSRLLADWSQLADYLDVPLPDRARFERGREPQGVWEWLEARGRLADLTSALAAVGRGDLVEVLQSRPR